MVINLYMFGFKCSHLLEFYALHWLNFEPFYDRLINKSTRRAQTSTKADPDNFENLTGTFLARNTSLVKLSCRSEQFFQRYEKNANKCPVLQCRRILKNSWYFCDKIVMKIRWVILTDKPTDRKTPGKYNLIGGNNITNVDTTDSLFNLVLRVDGVVSLHVWHGKCCHGIEFKFKL